MSLSTECAAALLSFRYPSTGINVKPFNEKHDATREFRKHVQEPTTLYLHVKKNASVISYE